MTAKNGTLKRKNSNNPNLYDLVEMSSVQKNGDTAPVSSAENISRRDGRSNTILSSASHTQAGGMLQKTLGG
jgi:hypothetical protein